MEITSLKFILFLSMYINIVVANSWRYDYTYIKKAKGYFKFHRIPAHWDDARMRCHFEGAVLVSPYPQEIRESLLAFMQEINNVTYNIFTGIHATFSAGDYQTIDGILNKHLSRDFVAGTPLARIPMKWMDYEPDNRDNAENCLIMSSDGFASDVKCTELHPYICYKKKKEVDIIQNPCGTTDLEYKKSDKTGNCYKVHTVPRTWHNAYRACYAEGGYLAILNSNDEAEFIKQLLAKYPEKKILGPYRKDIAFVGFYFWNVPGDWRTVHGETFEEAGYSNFHPNEPNNLSPGQYCGCIFRTAQLCDFGCDQRLAHICEKTPNSLICDEEDY